MKVGSGEWHFEYDTLVCWAISVLIFLNGYALFMIQSLRIFDEEGNVVSRQWDPSPISLTFFTYFSPIHVPIVFLRKFSSPICHAFYVDLALCIVQAMVLLLLADRFGSREQIQSALFAGCYNTEVRYRDKMDALREKAKAEVVSAIKKQ